MDLHLLPTLNATLNGLTAVWLVAGFTAIKKGRIGIHRAFMLAAVVTSTLFLTSYIIYHAQAGTTRFRSQGWVRPFYFTILVSHTALAVAVVPLVAVTLTRALRRRFPAHRRLARVTWPVWVYVSVTGILVYLFLYHLDPHWNPPDEDPSSIDTAGP